MIKKTFTVFICYLIVSQPLFSQLVHAEGEFDPAKIETPLNSDISVEENLDPEVDPQKERREEKKAEESQVFIEGVSTHHTEISEALIRVYAKAIANAEVVRAKVGLEKYIAMVNREEVVVFEPSDGEKPLFKAEIKLVEVGGRPIEFVRVVHNPSGFSYGMFDKIDLPVEYQYLAYDEIPDAIDKLMDKEWRLSQLRARQHIEANHKGRNFAFVLMDRLQMMGGKEYLKPAMTTGKYWKEYWQDIYSPITKSDMGMAAFFAVINGVTHYGLNYIRYKAQDVPMDYGSGMWSFIFPMFIGTILGTFNNWTQFPRDDVYPDKKKSEMAFRERLAAKKPSLIRDLKRSTSSISYAVLVTTHAFVNTNPVFITLTFWQKVGTVAGIVIPGFIVSRSVSRAWDTINIIRKEAREDVSNVKLKFAGKEYDTGWRKIRFQSQIINLAPMPLKIIDYIGFTSLTVFPFTFLHLVGVTNLPDFLEHMKLGLPLAQMATFPIAVYGALRVIDKIVSRKMRDPHVPPEKVKALENTVDYTFQRWLGVLATNPVSLLGSKLWLEKRLIPRKLNDPQVLPSEIEMWKHRLSELNKRWAEGYGIPPVRWVRKLYESLSNQIAASSAKRRKASEATAEQGPARDNSEDPPSKAGTGCETKLSA